MAKRNNVSNAELNDADEKAADLLQEVHDISERLAKMYHDDNLENLAQKARVFASLSRASSGLVVSLLSVAAIEEQKKEIAALRAAQA